MELLECQNITKRFGEFTALDNLTVSVPKGKIFGLLGPNGAGKTTLIRIINQITIPTDGKVLYEGSPISEKTVRKIGYLPEERGLYRKMKLIDQVVYLARLKGMSQEEAIEATKFWFKRFNIMSWLDKKVEELSKGMAQKVQFITTVIHNPSLLILDEPFSGFDPVNVQLIRNEILRLKDEGATIILSTHNMESVEELCDNIALINKSKLVLSGNTNEIRNQYGANRIEILYRGESLRPCGEYSIFSDQESHGRRVALLDINDDPKKVLAAIADAPIDLISFQKVMPRMADIFINLVTPENQKL